MDQKNPKIHYLPDRQLRLMTVDEDRRLKQAARRARLEHILKTLKMVLKIEQG